MIRPGRPRAGLIGVLLSLLTLMALPLPAHAQTTAPLSLQPTQYKLVGNTLDIVLAAPPQETIDRSTIRLTAQPSGAAGPQTIQPDISTVEQSGNTVKRSAMLALDTSGSMTPQRLNAAKQAALQFLQKVDKNVFVGLVTFGDPAQLRIRPTLDRDPVRTAVQNLTSDGDTAMYEAAVLAARAMGKEGTRSIVMLTDGVNEDTSGTKFTAAQARQALRGTNSEIDFTGVLVGDDSRRSIDAIDGAGSVITASDQAQLTQRLTDFFDDGAERIAQQVRLTAQVPPALAGRSVTLRLTAGTATGQPLVYIDDTTVQRFGVTPTGRSAPSGLTPVAPDRRFTAIPGPVAGLALLALFAAVAVFVFLGTGALTGSAEPESPVVRRLAVYSVATRAPQQIAVTEQSATRLGDSALARSAVGLMSRLARSGQVDRALDTRLEAAGLPLRTAEWMLLHVGSAVGISLLLLVLTRGLFAGLVLGLIIGLLLPVVVLVMLRSRRERNFLRQLPDTLQLLAGSLAAGYSLPQAMDSVAREAKPPISVEFNRALVEARLGMPPEDALEGIAQRTASKDFSWIVLAIRIQRDVGGNLAELLSSVADTLRERERQRRQVSALAAEGKLSGVILFALPIVFAVYLAVVQPDYISPLWTTPLGWLLVGTGLVLLAVGGFWMSRVVKVDV
jgi:tight adherence protein B